MDLLRKEMERKKRALAQARQGAAVPVAAAGATSTSSASGSLKPHDDASASAARASTRYLNAGQLRRLQEEEEERLKLSKRPRTNPLEEPSPPPPAAPSKEPLSSTTRPPVPTPASVSNETSKTPKKRSGDATVTSADDGAPKPPSSSSILAVDAATISSQLRGLGLAVRLFGEAGDDARLVRLHRAVAQQQSTLKSLSEKQEFRLGAGHAIRNPFLDQDKKRSASTTAAAAAAAATAEAHRPALKSGKAAKRKERNGDGDDDEDDDGTGDDGVGDESDPHKRIYAYLKALLLQWEHDLSLRPESVRSSVAGRRDTNTLQQCKDYIAPLFRLLKKRQLEDSLTSNLAKIVAHCREGEFVRANDAYMDIAIGRAAWPIGVTQVGIHSRTGRSKIESSNVAHVMNSELQRKYLTSVKRLMTYAQAKSTADPSKKVLN